MSFVPLPSLDVTLLQMVMVERSTLEVLIMVIMTSVMMVMIAVYVLTHRNVGWLQSPYSPALDSSQVHLLPL